MGEGGLRFRVAGFPVSVPIGGILGVLLIAYLWAPDFAGPNRNGIALANVIPLSWGLGFAGVLALLGILLSMLGDRTSWLATLVACTAAIAAFALPLKLNILVAIVAAVAAGLGAEAAARALHRSRQRAQGPAA